MHQELCLNQTELNTSCGRTPGSEPNYWKKTADSDNDNNESGYNVPGHVLRVNNWLASYKQTAADLTV